MEDSSKTQPIDLRDALRPITSRLWLIVICVALATGLTYYHYSSQPKEYRATTSLYIGSTDPSELVNPQSSDRATTDLADLVDSSAVAEAAAKELGFKGNPAALLSGISASPESGSDFVTVTAISGSGPAAAELANAVADAFVTTESASIRQQAAQSIVQAQKELDVLPNTITNQTQRGVLAETIQQLQGIESLPNSGIRHVNPAYPPGVPFAPNPKQNATFAFVIALLLTITGAYGLERLDRRIRKLADIERLYGYPVVATVPRTGKPAPSDEAGAAVLPDDVREAFRKLRLNLQLGALERPPKTIVVTSAVAREGKSTVTRNLALAYREAGLEVCVIDADLRRPSIAELLNVPNVPGLTDVVIGDETLADSLKRAAAGVPGLRTLARLHRGSESIRARPFLDAAGEPTALEPEVGSVVVLPSGPEPANPPVVLGSDQMRSVLASLGESFDVVLIDTSPLLAVSDAVPLLSMADGIIVVTRLAMTTTDAAENVVDQIRRVPGANLIGVVANDVHGRDGARKSYVYGYSQSRA